MTGSVFKLDVIHNWLFVSIKTKMKMELHSVASFLAYYKSIKERTKRVIQVIPHDKMDWAYKSGKFTIADQVRHIAAMERFMFAENISGKQCCSNSLKLANTSTLVLFVPRW